MPTLSRVPMSRICVIGAGILGLVAALRLKQRGHDVVVLERNSRPGGLAMSFEPGPGSDPLECFYHHIFRSDRSIIALISELGLGRRLIWKKPVTATFYDGELKRLDGAIALLSFSKLPMQDRLRLGFALALLKASPTAAPFHGTYAVPWLRKVAGEKAFTVIFQQIFESKFGPYAESISLAWFWARIHDRTISLGYLDGGFDILYTQLVQRIRSLGGQVFFNAPVAAVNRLSDGLAVSSPPMTGDAVFEQVLATIPMRRLASIASDLPISFAEKYEPICGLRARCLVLALDRQLTDSYWISIAEKNFPFMVVVEHTNLMDNTHYGGRHLIYFGNYGVDFPDSSEAALIDQFTPYIRRINPFFENSWIVDAWQFRVADAQPIITPNYSSNIAPHRTPVPGLYAANLHQIYPHDRGQNYSVELAKVVTSLIADDSRAKRFETRQQPDPK
ncbi:MAG: FAD-dependent oxidoreductase [Acidiferrobacteraceae bacterium]